MKSTIANESPYHRFPVVSSVVFVAPDGNIQQVEVDTLGTPRKRVCREIFRKDCPSELLRGRYDGVLDKLSKKR